MRQRTHKVHKRRRSCAKTATPCAHSARTAAPQGEHESARNLGNANTDFLQQSMHYVESVATRQRHGQKTWRKLPLEFANTEAGGNKEPPKSRPEAPMRAQMRSRVFNVRTAHVAPRRKGENESPRKCQYGFSAAIHALFTINGDTPKA